MTLRKHDDFLDEMAFVNAKGTEAVRISFWEPKSAAEAYDRTAHPQVLEAWSGLVDGTPEVSESIVASSTCHPAMGGTGKPKR